MNMAMQYPNHGSAMPPKKTRQRYRLGVDDGDMSPSRSGGRAPSPPYPDAYSGQQMYNDNLDYSVGSMPTQPQIPANGAEPRRRTLPDANGARQRPPSYETGSRSQEQAMTRGHDAVLDPPHLQQQQQQQQQGPSQPQSQQPPPSSSSQAQHQRQRSQAQPSSSARAQPAGARAPGVGHRQSLSAPQNAGASIARLKTPSVMDSVLQPLSQKVKEYDRLMHDAQEEIKHLDEELRALQARRDDAQNRFLDAQTRHEDWQQQYSSVERTLKGELPLPMPTQEPPKQPAGQSGPPVPQPQYHDDDDYDDDDDDGPHDRPWSANHQGSFASSKSKTRVRDRLRRSIFGA